MRKIWFNSSLGEGGLDIRTSIFHGSAIATQLRGRSLSLLSVCVTSLGMYVAIQVYMAIYAQYSANLCISGFLVDLHIQKMPYS